MNSYFEVEDVCFEDEDVCFEEEEVCLEVDDLRFDEPCVLRPIGLLLFSPSFLTTSPLDKVIDSSFSLFLLHSSTGTFSSIITHSSNATSTHSSSGTR